MWECVHVRGNVIILIFNQNSDEKYHIYKEMQNAAMDGIVKGKFVMARPYHYYLFVFEHLSICWWYTV